MSYLKNFCSTGICAISYLGSLRTFIRSRCIGDFELVIGSTGMVTNTNNFGTKPFGTSMPLQPLISILIRVSLSILGKSALILFNTHLIKMLIRVRGISHRTLLNCTIIHVKY